MSPGSEPFCQQSWTELCAGPPAGGIGGPAARAAFNDRLWTIGIQSIVTPYRAPQASAVVERLVGTLRRERFDHVIALSERHVRRVLREYVAYYNVVRPHQTLSGQPPAGPRPRALRSGQLVAHPILGGLHHEYDWAAA